MVFELAPWLRRARQFLACLPEAIDLRPSLRNFLAHPIGRVLPITNVPDARPKIPETVRSRLGIVAALG